MVYVFLSKKIIILAAKIQMHIPCVKETDTI